MLLLGGTAEASALAAELVADRLIDLIVSLAGRTSRPLVPVGQVRIGGFGGAAGLAAYLEREAVDLVVDATHPFAAIMPWNALEACQQRGVPLLKLSRPAWASGPGDRWHRVPDLTAAAAALAAGGARRVLLTTGRQELEPFRALRGIVFLVRAIEPPDLAGFEAATAVLARGPFALEGERTLLREHAIDTLVTKNSGGSATAAKLAAARELGVLVVMVDRPALPSMPCVADVESAVAWVSGRLRPTGTSAE